MLSKARFRFATLLAVAAALAISCGALKYLAYRLTRVKVVEVESQQDWPRPLKSLYDSSKMEGQTPKGVCVCYIDDLLDRYYFWRMDASPEIFAIMKAEFDLYTDDSIDIDFGPQEFLPAWWDPPSGDVAEYLGRADRIGMKGDKYQVLHDTARNRVYVYYHENW